MSKPELPTSTTISTFMGTKSTISNSNKPDAINPPSFDFGTKVTSSTSVTSNPLPSFQSKPDANTGLGSKPADSATDSVGTKRNLTSANSSQNTSETSKSVPLTFALLEEYINKWTLQLEEQQKLFINQASHINAWDKLTNEHTEKIVGINVELEKLKGDQENLNNELEFLTSQYIDLEEIISSIEKDVKETPLIESDRLQTYTLAENLDCQLKMISQNIKEAIEYLNEANKYQDCNDPIAQISKILNVHMESLEWIETSSIELSAKLADIEAKKTAFRHLYEQNAKTVFK